jgi:hypothetical protein
MKNNCSTSQGTRAAPRARAVSPVLALLLALPLLAQAQMAPEPPPPPPPPVQAVPPPPPPPGAAYGRHPAYLHALTDLRDARWFIEHRPDAPIGDRERHAIGEIDRAIEEVQRAAYHDGKNVYEHPREDAYLTPGGRLRRASELLRSARNDVAQPEDNPGVREAQFHAIEHIDSAIRLAESVMVDRERGREFERDREYDRR